MLQKKEVIVTASLIVLIIGFSNIILGQGLPRGSPEARELQLRNLLDTVEGVAEEPPRVFRTEEGILRLGNGRRSSGWIAESVRLDRLGGMEDGQESSYETVGGDLDAGRIFV
ncbi:MAG: hypothetical protein JSU70_17750 [Phycisphaerales bacterium]|nr:MAG: hypothetical protein JSU70_17750 [Phycisphaerales bacterium]